MQVQKVRFGHNRCSYIVLDENHLPVKPIVGFIRYLDNTDKSPHTLRTYANHLKLYWDYLNENSLDWQKVSLEHLSGFIGWLRAPMANHNIINLTEMLNRKRSTINSVLGCLSSFYRYHRHLGHTDVFLTETAHLSGNRYKSLLHHVYRHKPTQRRLISMRQEKRIPKVIQVHQYQAVLEACCNPRDKFLVALLYETGMRIGQALGLHHEDIISWDNEIHLQPRMNNQNEARDKSSDVTIIHVTSGLISLYSRYMNTFPQEATSEYVFLNLNNFQPLRYSAVRNLFRRLSKKVGIKLTAHMFRHTHATELIKTGVDASLVKQRLGHASIQTTIDTYMHADQETMKNALKAYWNSQTKREVKK